MNITTISIETWRGQDCKRCCSSRSKEKCDSLVLLQLHDILYNTHYLNKLDLYSQVSILVNILDNVQVLIMIEVIFWSVPNIWMIFWSISNSCKCWSYPILEWYSWQYPIIIIIINVLDGWLLQVVILTVKESPHMALRPLLQ